MCVAMKMECCNQKVVTSSAEYEAVDDLVEYRIKDLRRMGAPRPLLDWSLCQLGNGEQDDQSVASPDSDQIDKVMATLSFCSFISPAESTHTAEQICIHAHTLHAVC